MLAVTIERERVRVGDRFSVSFQRTRRVPPGELGALPPSSRGALVPHRPDEFASRVPPEWLGRPGVFVPLFPDEAVWLGFAGADAKPVALKIRAGSQNAVTGGAWNEELHDQPQDYLVCPDQSSWDGVACGEGQIRQFTGTPLDLLIYEPRPGVTVKRLQPGLPDFYYSLDLSSVSFVTQRLVSDPYGITSWSSEPTSRLSIYFVSPSSYHEMTGEDPLPIDSVYTPRLLP